MRRLLAVLTIACLGLAFAGTLPASATDASTLNHQVSGSLDYFDQVDLPQCPTGGGQVMPYYPASGGPGSLAFAICVSTYVSTTIVDEHTRIYTYSEVGAFEILTPGGDTVRGDVAGTFTEQDNDFGSPNLAWDLTFTVRYGTGQFEGATGTIKLVGTFHFGGRVDGHGGTMHGSLAGSLKPATK